MPKKKRAGQRRPHQQRHLHAVPAPAEAPAGPPPQLQPLLQQIRRAMRSAEPLDLLTLISAIFDTTDPRREDPFVGDPVVPRADLIDSFIEFEFAETTALLTLFREFLVDQALRERVEKALANRRHPLPLWLGGLAEARWEGQVHTMVEALGDGDDYVFEVSIPSGPALTAVVYVDHNLNGAVKDAFVVPEAIDAVTAQLRELSDASASRFGQADPATTRALVTEAIAHSAMITPPVESETWPGVRPVIEWMLRKLPDDGTWERDELGEQERARLVEEFLASPYAAALDEDQRGYADVPVWFAVDYAGGDPLRFSPIMVETFLTDWLPRKLTDSHERLAKAPEVLRAYIKYCHDVRGVPQQLTLETLAAVDSHEPLFRAQIDEHRGSGPAQILAKQLGIDVDDIPDDLLDALDGDLLDDFLPGEYVNPDLDELVLSMLADEVGGRDALLALDDVPLPDEEFDWTGVPDDIHGYVGDVLSWCDSCAAELFDTEHRTAMRRFLAHVAREDPAIFRRRSSPVRGAAAIAWVIGKANATVAYGPAALPVKDLLAWFGVQGGHNQRAEPMLRAWGINPHTQFGEMDLGTPELLTGAHRSRIIMQRDEHLVGDL